MVLQSAYHPTDALCNAPFMTNVNSYMFRHEGPYSYSQNKGV